MVVGAWGEWGQSREGVENLDCLAARRPKREGRGTPVISVLTGLCSILQQEMAQAPYTHGDAAAQDALNDASVEGAHNGGQGSCSPQFPQKLESLMSSFWPVM